MYRFMLLTNPTAKVPTRIVSTVRTVRDLLPQKSDHTFFQRLLMTALLAEACHRLRVSLPSGAAPRVSLRIGSTIHGVGRSRCTGLPQVRFQSHARMPFVCG